MTNKLAPGLKELFERKENVFKRPEVFDIEYTPEKLIAREEAEIMFNKILSFLKSRITQNIFIYGSHGSGKTAYSKYIKAQSESIAKENNLPVRIEYINCRFTKNLMDIPEILFREEINRKRDSFESMVNFLDKDLILILDEVDESQEPSDFLYFLSRFQEIQTINKNKIMIFLISNKKEWDKSLDSAVRSSLALEKIEFKNYSKGQIKEILKQRINDGLINPKIVSEEIINLLVEKTIDNHSDLRIALKALSMIISEMQDRGQKNISDKSIENLYSDAVRVIQLSRIGQIDNGRFMILYAIAVCASDNSRDIHKAYTGLVSGLNVKPLGYTRFTYYVNTLENQSFIEIRKGKKDEEREKNIVVNKIKLRVNSSVVKEEFESRKMQLTTRR